MNCFTVLSPRCKYFLDQVIQSFCPVPELFSTEDRTYVYVFLSEVDEERKERLLPELLSTRPGKPAAFILRVGRDPGKSSGDYNRSHFQISFL